MHFCIKNYIGTPGEDLSTVNGFSPVAYATFLGGGLTAEIF